MENWRYYRVLAAQREAHPEWMGAGELARALGVTIGPAATYRRTLQDAGLLEVEEGKENNIPFVRTRLTPDGLKMADHMMAAAEVAKRAREKQKR